MELWKITYMAAYLVSGLHIYCHLVCIYTWLPKQFTFLGFEMLSINTSVLYNF
ncbi:hypothetical protein HanHA300_Chr12g0439031 [Helianthus annuus]|nr:hypothetical protein HanHA300_Chr12g0439031 [Helianthus annuus]KAJ0504868.1 hypothetical protein HanHA89_Chr12g0464051 [Helianthus annuus]KAJ0674565.1 hypothetical protein HanLR1_Chr12g0441341 [Helianthus annuus]